MRIKDNFMLRPFDDKYIVVSLGNSQDEFNSLITLNNTGAFIWKKLEKGISYDELLNCIVSEYKIDNSTAKADLDEFIAGARSAGLILDE